MLISTLCYASLSPMIKKVSQNKLGPFTVMTFSMLVLFLLSLILAYTFEGLGKFDFATHKIDVMILLVVGAINMVGFWLAIKSFDYFPIWLQQMFGLLVPIIAGVFAYFILGEKFSPKLFYGLALMGTGLFVALR